MAKEKQVAPYQTKSEYAYRTIREGIISRRFLPGSPLVITGLASSLGISETPVRDALRMLISEGFVDYNDHIGANVASPSLDDLKNMFEIMICLQGAATRLAALRVTEGLLRELKNILEKTKVLLKENRNEEYGILNDQFHDTIENMCGNREIEMTIRVYREKTSWVRSLFVLKPERLRESFDEHVNIYQAIKDGKYKEVEKIVTEHIILSFNAFLNFLGKEKGYEENKYAIQRDIWI